MDGADEGCSLGTDVGGVDGICEGWLEAGACVEVQDGEADGGSIDNADGGNDSGSSVGDIDGSMKPGDGGIETTASEGGIVAIPGTIVGAAVIIKSVGTVETTTAVLGLLVVVLFKSDAGPSAGLSMARANTDMSMTATNVQPEQTILSNDLIG
eukprot:m.196125 g.196125  ORF g.196125 m.196125 type:complete len:154 (+) comp32606_c0_seq1:3450-3911(+)